MVSFNSERVTGGRLVDFMDIQHRILPVRKRQHKIYTTLNTGGSYNSYIPHTLLKDVLLLEL